MQDRRSIALNINANDAKLRSNRVVRFAHFAVAAGGGHLVHGNHFFQGDTATAGIRRAGIVITQPNARLTFTGNYVDNCFLEWSNEHDADPNFTAGFSFGNISVCANHFFASDVAANFAWLVLAPKGSGHFLHGFSVSDNTFRTINTVVDRCEGVDTTNGTLDFGRFRNVTFQANAFNGITQIVMSPLSLQHSQNTAAETWVVDGGNFMPFGSRVRNTMAVVADGPLTNSANQVQFVSPYALNEQGSNRNLVHLRWPLAVRGKVLATIRCDNPT